MFDIVMDVVAALFALADSHQLFQHIDSLGVKHRMSLFLYDVVLVIYHYRARSLYLTRFFVSLGMLLACVLILPRVQ